MAMKPRKRDIGPSTRWLTPDETAEYLKVSRGSLVNLVRSGVIPAPKSLTTRILRYDREAIDRALTGSNHSERNAPTPDDVDWETDRKRRKREWQEEQARKPSANRPWLERERREREERARLRNERKAKRE
jgi:excisionase family DNA binding protein